MTPEIKEKINYLENQKEKYRESLDRSIFKKDFYGWVKQELLGEPNYTPKKIGSFRSSFFGY